MKLLRKEITASSQTPKIASDSDTEMENSIQNCKGMRAGRIATNGPKNAKESGSNTGRRATTKSRNRFFFAAMAIAFFLPVLSNFAPGILQNEILSFAVICAAGLAGIAFAVKAIVILASNLTGKIK